MTEEGKGRRSAALTVADSLQTITDLTRDMMADPNLGIWSFEMDEGKPPRMYGNKAMDALLGCDGSKLTPEEYYHAWYDHIDPDHYGAVHTTVEKMVAGHQAEVQYPFLHPTRGSMMVRCGGRRDMAYAPGLRIIGRHQDVSELLHFERKTLEAIAAERDLAVASEQAQSLFFSTVSHDIRTPLNAIVGFAELLEGGVADEAERRQYVKTIRSSSKMLSRLIDDVLDLSKLQSGKLQIVREPTDVPQLIREVVASFEVFRARKSIIFRSEVDEMPCVVTDPHRLRQILFNLLSNAFKYTDQGAIDIVCTWRDGTFSVAVRDTGCGISKGDMDRILKPFVQVADRNHRDGTGLGLPICTRLAKLLGGELTIDSTPGRGSTFTVTLRGLEVCGVQVSSPRKEDSLRSATTTQNYDSQTDSARRHVLIVDDSSVNLAVLKAMLARCGVTDIRTAANGKEALAALDAHPETDLVLTDYWMPELDGVGLVRAIRAREKERDGRRLEVYLITADVDAGKDLETSDFSGIILKPVSTEDITRIVG